MKLPAARQLSKFILPLLGLLFLLGYLFGHEFLVYLKGSSIIACRDSSCETTDCRGSGDQLEIDIPTLNTFDWKMSRTQPITTVVPDTGNGIDPETFSFYVDMGRNPVRYTIHDDEIEYTRENDRHVFVFTPSEPYLKDYSVFFFASICDCTGKSVITERFSTVCHDWWCVYNTWPAYLLQCAVWYLAIFAPMIIRRPWGIVYDSQTKEPIPRAVIRLMQNNKLIATTVTDVMGVFRIKPKPGTYTISVQHHDYTFPSHLRPQARDGALDNLYYGSELIVKRDQKPLQINIPMDPQTENPRATVSVLKNSVLSSIYSINTIFLCIGSFIPVTVYGINPQSVTFSSVNLFLLIVQLFLKSYYSVRWGKVIDEERKPVPNIDILLHNQPYGQLIDTTTTDRRGRFQFVAPGGEYQLSIKSGEFVLADGEVDRLIFKSKKTGNFVISPTVKVRKAVIDRR
ncbi:MAG: carboxypeptidase-like regulatory domain-containing protein [Candidatus Dojkabacteria bacterium]|nr:carboxypeptidase-like regulatory domain-containing protein [Candidatus Dojkabacteria bacterium]